MKFAKFAEFARNLRWNVCECCIRRRLCSLVSIKFGSSGVVLSMLDLSCQVRDQSSCVEYQTQCGEFCIECHTTNSTCKRCEFDKKLDDTACVDECRAKNAVGDDLYE